ncbi:MAG TPA: histidine kinase [Nocardioides sp.]|uniref:histidine kinase n=1 Tax=Nocardioides sp. TaxID=35761 RepID=UPI002E319160|nr:histidine kinase [Nocardioides sp.]HEX5090819.1 histidine kinase [Nocardioides sp.]
MSARSTRLLPSADTALALGFVLAAAVEFAWRRDGRLWLAVPGACLMLVLVVRRTHPLLAVTVFTAANCLAVVVQHALDDGDGQDSGAFVAIFALVVMMYSLGAHADTRQLLAGCWQPVLIVVVEDLLEPGGNSLASGLAFFSLLVVGLPVAAGRLVRGHRLLVSRLRHQEALLAAAHHDRLAAARAAESLRLGHALEAMLSAGLGRLEDLALSGGPDTAARVEAEARELLARTRTVVVGLSQPLPERADPAPDVDARPPTPVVVLGAEVVAWTAVVVGGRLLDPLAHGIVGAVVAVALAFTGGALLRLRPAIVALGVCLAGVAAAYGPDDAPGIAVFAVLAWLAGWLTGSQARLAARLRHTTAELAELQRGEVERARLEERATAAHELHDSVGHALTAITLQAEAARRWCDARPERTREVLATVAQVAAAARTDLRSGFAGGDDLAGLVDGARAAGLQLAAELDESCVPPALRRVVYRVLQEALTNVLRHAPGAAAEVRLGNRDGAVALVVRNGPGARPGEPSTAVGLAGMQRRIEDVGGRLAWEQRQDGGFELRASFAGVVVG